MEKYFELVRVDGHPERPKLTSVGLIPANSIEEAISIAKNYGLPMEFRLFSAWGYRPYFYVASPKGGYSSPEEANQANEEYHRKVAEDYHGWHPFPPSDLEPAPPKLHVLTPSDLTTLRRGK